MVFFGEYEVSFTGTGRIVLPKTIRELLKGNVFVLSKGFDECLVGYDRDDWEQRAQDLMTTSLLEKENMDRKRFLFASTIYAEVDDQGRFVIPKNLLQFADLSGIVVIIGVGDHFEIWNRGKWARYMIEIKN